MVSRKIYRANDCTWPLPLADSLRRRKQEGSITRSTCQLVYLVPRNALSPRVLRYTVPALLT